MKRCITRYFGNMEYLDESVLHFPDGLPGFDCEHNFLPIQQPESAPLVYLQSLTLPDLCFVALPATVACRDYQPLLSEHDAELLESTPEQIGRLLTLVLLSIAENRLTAN